MASEENNNPNFLNPTEHRQPPPQSRFADINEENDVDSFSESSSDSEMNELEE